MKEGLRIEPLTLMDELKTATDPAHLRLGATPFFEVLAEAKLPLESYVGQLRAFAVIHGVLEQALVDCDEERVASVWNVAMRKFALLQQDMTYFEPRVVADIKPAVEAALKVTEQIRLLTVESPLSLLGFLYVLEGSTLGAAVVRPLIARRFHLEDSQGMAYLNNYGDEVDARWSGFKQRMNALTLSVEERQQILKTARDFFNKLETVFLALYPFEPDSKTFAVTSINPEAGRHAVPTDAREIQAALRASEICWRQFPYYEHRYGERGRRFARSDCAWKTTLCQYEPERISQQVKWLGRVLAGRGMPTFLLWEQLEILVKELSASIPEKQATYKKLLPAAEELREARRNHLTDDQVLAIATEFDDAVGSEWSARFPFTGLLLSCAVADELNGSELAVESLRPWMTDPARFPARWITAVETSLAQARGHATESAA